MVFTCVHIIDFLTDVLSLGVVKSLNSKYISYDCGPTNGSQSFSTVALLLTLILRDDSYFGRYTYVFVTLTPSSAYTSGL